jgi:nitrite reductase/ring-hydroxylating ferredoxin subunit
VELGFVGVAGISDIEVGKMKKVMVGDVGVWSSILTGFIMQLTASALHFGGDLSEGNLEGNIITCPVHKAIFDVTTGNMISPLLNRSTAQT